MNSIIPTNPDSNKEPRIFYSMIALWPYTLQNRLSDMVDQEMANFFHLYLKVHEKWGSPPVILGISPVSFLENTRIFYNENFSSIQNMVPLGNWEFPDGAWVSYAPEFLSNESIIRQYLAGQRFLIKWFHQESDSSIFCFYQSLDKDITEILPSLGIFHLVFANPIGQEYNIPLNFTWQAIEPGQNQMNSDNKQENDFVFNKNTSKLLVVQSFLSKSLKKSLKYALNLANLNSHAKALIFLPLIGSDLNKRWNFQKNLQKLLTKKKMKYGRLGTCAEFWQDLEQQKSTLPVLASNIFGKKKLKEQHQINFITSAIKSCEILFHQTEMLSVFAGILGGPHSQNDLSNLWLLFLRQQDRTLIEGKVITEVLRDSAHDFRSIFSALLSTQENSLMHIGHSVKITLNHDVFTIFNSLSWNRNGYFTLPARSFNHALDFEGQPLIVQNIAHTPFTLNREVQLGLTHLEGLTYLKNVEKEWQDYQQLQDLNYPVEYSVNNYSQKRPQEQLIEFESQLKDNLLIYLPEHSAVKPFGILNITGIKGTSNDQVRDVVIYQENNQIIFENVRIIVKISCKTGCIEWLSVKSQDPKEQNLIRSHLFFWGYYPSTDSKYENSSSIDFEKISHNKRKIFQVSSIEIVERGPIRYSVLCRYKALSTGTDLHIYYYFYHKTERIDVETLVNWQEPRGNLYCSITTVSDMPRITRKTLLTFENEVISHFPPISDKSDTISSLHDLKVQDFIIRKSALLNETSKTSLGLAIFLQNKHFMYGDSNTTVIKLLGSAPCIKAKTKTATLDSDHNSQILYQEIGFHRILWALHPIAPNISDLHIYRKYQEYNIPLIAVPTNAVHSSVSFLEVSPESVEITCLKEIEPYMPEAPDWFYRSNMNELAFIIRCINLEDKAQVTHVNLKLHESFAITKVEEVDPIEKIVNQNIDPEPIHIKERNIQFELRPFQLKTILIVCRLLLEE
ncbi:MAG: glycoside hydrolase family 38 C-terminal domain-containing protein [Promethearchaeota archaeon]